MKRLPWSKAGKVEGTAYGLEPCRFNVDINHIGKLVLSTPGMKPGWSLGSAVGGYLDVAYNTYRSAVQAKECHWFTKGYGLLREQEEDTDVLAVSYNKTSRALTQGAPSVLRIGDGPAYQCHLEVALFLPNAY